MSPRWTFEGDPAQGSIVIRSVWHNWQVLYAQAGQVKYDNVPTTGNNAKWFLESANGTAVADRRKDSMAAGPLCRGVENSRRGWPCGTIEMGCDYRYAAFTFMVSGA
jgi:hypothetical protein